MASGIPSSRRQISATAPTGSTSRVEIRPAGPGPLGEQFGGVRVGERRDGRHLFALDTQRLSTGDEHRHLRAVAHNAVGQLGGRVQHMLAVVDYQQQLERSQIVDQCLVESLGILLLQSQRRCDRVRQRGTVGDWCEFAEPRTVGESVLAPVGELEGESGLADSADPGERHLCAALQSLADDHDFSFAPDKPLRQPRQVRRGGGVARHRGRRWGCLSSSDAGGGAATFQNLLMDLAQRRAGIDAEFVDEPFTHHAVGFQRLGLTAAAVLGEHHLGGKAFVKRMGLVCRSKFADDVGVPTRAQRGVVAVELNRKAFRFNSITHVVDPWGVQRRERLAPPE